MLIHNTVQGTCTTLQIFTYPYRSTAIKWIAGLNLSLLSPAPDVPATLNHTNIAPDKFHGPRVNLTWSKPIKANGIIRNYTLFYGHEKDTQKETFGKDTLSYSVDVLGGLTYEFSVRAVTIKPGEIVTLTVNIPEYGRFSFLSSM